LEQEPTTESGSAWQMRWAELLTALTVLVIAGLVIFDSLRVGIGWADDGPRSGYFPFRIGVGLALCSAWLVLRQLMQWRRSHEVFAERSQLKDVAAVLSPTMVYVALIPWLGIYVPSSLLVAWFMWRNKGYRWWSMVSVSVGVSAALFLLFEIWFQLPLPKGPLEAYLGY